MKATMLAAALILALGGCATPPLRPIPTGEAVDATPDEIIPFVMAGFIRPDREQAALAAHYYCSARGSVAEYVATSDLDYGTVAYYRCRRPVEG